MKRLATLLGTLGLATALGTQSAGAAVTQGNVESPTGSVTFNTAFSPTYHGAGEYDGVLHLTFGSGGTVSGWYHPADVGTIRTVSGGLDGDKIWLDLGGVSPFPIEATYDNGKIAGSTFVGNELYSFTATPTK